MDTVVPRLTGSAILFVGGSLIALFSRREKAVMWWYLFTLWIHLLLEVNYAVAPQRITTFATTGFWEYAFEPVKVADFFTWDFWVDNYRQYAKYDLRYTQNTKFPPQHPDLVAITLFEIPQTLLCFILPFLIQSGSKWRHPLQIINAMMQAYGAVIYFAVPYLRGTWWTDFHSKDMMEHWLGVYALNGLWIIVPTLLILQSCFAIVGSLPNPPSAAARAIQQQNKPKKQ